MKGHSCKHCCSGGKKTINYLFWVCICSLRYPACNAHAPYCNLWFAPLYNIFPHYLIISLSHYLINGMIFVRKNFIIIIIIIYLSWSWATCWPVPVSRTQKSLERSAMIPFCQLGNSVSIPWVIYYRAFYLHVVSSFSCIPVICLNLVLFLIPLQFVYLFCNLSQCILLFFSCISSLLLLFFCRPLL